MRFKQILETTTAGSVATVAQPMMTQTRESINVPGLKPVQQVMKGKSKKKGLYANSIVEGKVKELSMDLRALADQEFQKKYGKTKAEIRSSMKKEVTEDDLSEQDLIVIPGQGRLKRTGFVKHDLDQGEHEGHTLKNSLHTIARAASDLDKRLSVQSEFPEWVSEKIGAAKGMMVSVMDYLISSQEMQHDDRDEINEYDAGIGNFGVFLAAAFAAGKTAEWAKMKWEEYKASKKTSNQYTNAINEGDVSTGNLQTMYNLARMAKNYCSDPEGKEALTELLRILKWYMDQAEQNVTESSQRVDSLVTDALRVMKGPEVSDAVLALKRVLGDRAYNERRGFYSFYVDQIHRNWQLPMYGQQGVSEGWKDEADDFTGWSNHVKEKLSKAAPEQRLGIAKQLSQIEVKNFGSTIQGGFNRQTGKAQPGLGLTDTVRNIFKSFSQEQQDIHAYNTKDEDGKAGTPDAGKFQTKFGSIFVYGMENATQIELVLMGKAVRMGPDYSKAAQEIYRKTGTLTVDDLKGIRKGFEDNANKMGITWHNSRPGTSGEEQTPLGLASLAQQDQRLKENSTPAAGVDAKGRTAQEWVKLVKAKYPDAKIMQSKMPNGPWAAKLSDGRTTYWEPAEEGMAEGKIDFAKKLQGKVDKHNKAVVKTKQAVGSRVADIGAGGKEHNEKTDAAWDAAKKKVAESYKKK